MAQAKLPSLDHIHYADYEYVYEPAEDSYLLCDALLHDLSNIVKLQPSFIVEIGPGTGIIGTYLCQLLKEYRENQQRIDRNHQELSSTKDSAHKKDPSLLSSTVSDSSFTGETVASPSTDCSATVFPQSTDNVSSRTLSSVPTVCLPQYIAIDMNPYACRITSQTALHNHVHPYIECIQGDLLYPILQRCDHSIDILIFNPPYVPTPDAEVFHPTVQRTLQHHHSSSSSSSSSFSLPSVAIDTDILTGAWAGGTNGRIVIDRLLPLLTRALRLRNTIGYMIVVEENQPDNLRTFLAKEGFQSKIILTTKAKNERLSVLKFWR